VSRYKCVLHSGPVYPIIYDPNGNAELRDTYVSHISRHFVCCWIVVDSTTLDSLMRKVNLIGERDQN
jgi:hypothetical protein